MKTKILSANPDMGYIRFALSVVLSLSAFFSFGQPGKSGAVTISALNTVVNCYSPVTNNITAGATSVTVNNSGGSNCNWECGDMVMIYQAQGASINTADSPTYGDITAYNNSGLYEFNYVTSMSGNTVNLQNPVTNNYTSSGRVQLIKVPSYTTLTVNAGASIVPILWQDGGGFRKGGVVAIHCLGTVTVNGMIQATSFGFRPGATEQNTSGTGTNFVASYVSASSSDGAEKGESIAGFGTEYATGAYNRGAPANGGGGGNGHNAGGGGGANGLNGTPWNGQGIMCTSCPGTAAWLLDPYVIANGNVLTTSSGGGRGGYSYGSSNQNALTTAPSNTNWGGDNRDPNGGLGGRPLVINPQTRIFFGGGGGAGDSNNGSNAPGGSGGGIVYIIAPNIAGSGSIRAQGGAAVNQISTGNGSANDAPAGGGGGGTIIIKGAVANSLTLDVSGGKGGDQGPLGSESEGPGGGGGGGYIAITSGTPTQIIAGGQSGMTLSSSLTEFVENGATNGGTGQIGTVPNTFIDYTVTDITATVNTPVCVGNAINFTTVVSTPGGTYAWTGPNGYTSTAANPTIASAALTHSGNYQVIYTTPGGCKDTFLLAVVVNPLPVIALTGTNLSCATPCNGSVALNITTTTAPSYTFAWSNGATTQNISGLCAGNYSVTMTDANSCTAAANVTITAPTAVSATAAVTNASCNNTCNGAIAVTASGGTAGYQYSLNGAANQASNNYTALCDGSYVVRVTDANGCFVDVNTTITEPPVLNINLVSTVPSSCGVNNGSLTVSASGGTPGYQFTVGAVTQASGTFNGLGAGTYNVIVTDANGCTKNLSVTVTSTVSPTATIASQQPVSCFGGFNGSAVIGVTGGTPGYTFSLAPGGPANQASNVFNNLQAGAYTVTVTDANGCTATVPLIIVQPAQLNYTTTVTNATCNGLCNGQIQITASGGTAPYDYSHDNGLTFTPANPITNLCAGTVEIVVRDSKGCLVNSTVNITQPAPLSAAFTTVDPVCNGSCDGSITVTPSGGVPAYNYSLNGGTTQASNTILNVCSGTQDVLITDANGCTLEVNPVLVDPPAIQIDLVDMIESNCGFNNGELIVTASGPNPGFTYSANGGPTQTNGTFSNIYAGAYDIVVTDDLGCQAQEFFGVNDVEMDGILITQTNPLCYGSFDGTVEVTNVNGAGPINYELDMSGVTQSSGFFPSLGEGSHVVVITDAGNCVFTLPFTLTQPDPLTFDPVVTNVACYGDSTGAIEFTNAAGGTAPYMFSADGGSNFVPGTTFGSLPVGTYGLAIADINGCLETGSETITQTLPIEITNNKIDLTCFQNNSGFIQLGATGGNGGFQYSIDSGANFSASSSFIDLSALTYNIVVMDQAGCLQDTTITLSQPALLVAAAVPTDVLCNNACDGTITGTGTGGTVNYMFSVDGGVIFNVNGLFNNLCAGNYDLIVRDFNTCSDTVSAIIGTPAGVSLTVSLTPSTCENSNGEIDMSLSGGTMPYNYSIDNGANFTTTNVFTGLAANDYTLTAEDANGCGVDSIVTIVNMASPVISGVYITEPTCYSICDAAATVDAVGGTGALSFEINGVTQANNIFNNLCAGTYDVIITDVNTCKDTLNIVIDQPDTLVFTSTATNLTCFQNQSGTITVTVQGGTGPFEYSYDGGTTFGLVANAQILDAGTYNIVVRDDNDCEATGTEVLTQPTLLTATLNLTDPTCYEFCNGTAVATATGGTPNYIYHWNGVAGTSTNPNLCSGNYTLEVTDANNCSFDTTYVITDPAEFVIDSVGHTNTTCNTFCDGTATIYAPGAVSYSFDNGGTFGPADTQGSLCAQAYQVQATNAAGCIATSSVAVEQPLPVQLFSSMDSLMCTGDVIPLYAVAFGGTAPYTYTWSNGFVGQTQDVIQNTPQTYTVSVTDQNGCTTAAPDSVDLTMLPVLAFNITGDTSICAGSTIVLAVNVTDGAPTYSYQWSTSVNDTLSQVTVNPTAATLYNVSVSDVCVTVDTNVQVNFYAVPTAQFVTSAQQGCIPLDITFSNDLSISNLQNCTWTFSDGQTFNGCGSFGATFDDPGCYDVTFTGTTTDGCPVTGTFVSAVCVYDNPVADFTYSPQMPTELDNRVQFTNTSYGAVTFDWTFGSSFGTSNLENPAHTFYGVDPDQVVNVCLVVASEYGCSDTFCKPIKFYGDFLVWVPNTFTPDGDEFNNQFKPVFSKDRQIDEYNLMIFNRWGELIFESLDPEFGWDGTYNGEFVKDGTYTWKIYVKDGMKSKSEEFIGHVNKLQ